MDCLIHLKERLKVCILGPLCLKLNYVAFHSSIKFIQDSGSSDCYYTKVSQIIFHTYVKVWRDYFLLQFSYSKLHTIVEWCMIKNSWKALGEREEGETAAEAELSAKGHNKNSNTMGYFLLPQHQQFCGSEMILAFLKQETNR